MSTLLEQIAALGDDAFIAWERADRVDELTRCAGDAARDKADPNDFRVRMNYLDSDIGRMRPFIIQGAIFLAVFIEEVGEWVFRLPGESDYRPMEARAAALIPTVRIPGAA